jgi:hypothetical protein
VTRARFSSSSRHLALTPTSLLQCSPQEVILVKSKIDAIVFFLLLLVAVFGLVSFSTEFFLGKPLVKVIQEILFMLYRKQ